LYKGGLIVLVACGTAEPKDDTADTGEADADTDTDTDTDTDSDADTDIAGTATLSGRVLEEDGTPVPDARVNLCRDTCFTVTTDLAGSYVYDALQAWTTSFYVLPPTGSGLMAPLATLTLEEEEVLSVDIVLHPPTASAPLPATAAEVELSGLLLTAGADMLEPLPFTELGDTISAAAVDPAETLPLELEGAVLAVWHLAPFEATAAAGMPLRILNSWGLPPGESYRVWVVSEPYTYSWLDQGTLTVSEDGSTLEGSVLIPILSTVVLVDD
jgi:hypothetical protein